MSTATLDRPTGPALGAQLGVAVLVISGSLGIWHVPSEYGWSGAVGAVHADHCSPEVYRVDTTTGQREIFIGGDFLQTEGRKHATIVEFRDLSGLTASQVGRLFGVSRRSVNNWISGKPMAPDHEERLSELLAIIRGISAPSPAERRAALLDSSSGSSIFHQLLRDATAATPLQMSPLRPSDQF